MKVAVIGAGLAGLTAACDVADAGCRVVVFERRPWAGGKTYSFADVETGEQVDNGQHIAMHCTTAYVEFLERLGTAHLINWQPHMRVPVFDAAGRRSDLAASALPAPLHLAPSFAMYRHLALADKARIARAIIAMRRLRAADRSRLNDVSFADWLRRHGQSATAIRDFWDLIVVPALNCRCDDASAEQALFIFEQGFLKSATSAAIGVPRAGLSELHVQPALRYIEQRGGEIRTSAAVESIAVRDGRVEAIVLAGGERIVADAYVAALPPRHLLDALPPDLAVTPPFDALRRIRTSPIVNLHLWFDCPVVDFDFAAFTGRDPWWVFAPGSGEHLVVSLSAADRYLPLDKRELVELLLPQLHRALPRTAARRLLRSSVIKEPDATFVPAPGLRRPDVTTPIANIFLGGAYTDTGWPATMESAVRSGHDAARALLAQRADLAQEASPREHSREAAPVA